MHLVALLPLLFAASDPAIDPELARASDLWKGAISSWHSGQALALAVKTEAAIEKYEEAIVLFGRGAMAAEDFAPLTNCLTDLGAAWLASGKPKLAQGAFERAIAIDEHFAPDPHRYNPDTVRAFQKTESDLMRRPRGSLTVIVRPEGAMVSVDGKRAGAAPISIRDLLPGEHVVLVSRAGYHHFAETMSVASGGALRREVFLPALEGVAPGVPRVAPASAPAIVPTRSVPFALAIVPFGGGQLAEHRPVAGALFLIGEAALLATNIATAAIVLSDHRYPDGTFANGPRDRALQVINLSALSALILTVAGGAIDGAVHRN